MSIPYDITFAPCHSVLANVNSDGTISIPANDTPVLVATVPLTTGPVPLNVTTLGAVVSVTYDAVTNTGGNTFQHKEWSTVARVKGNPTPASLQVPWSFSSLFNDELGLELETNGAGNYFAFDVAINGSGDLEISIEGKSSGGLALTFRNLRVSYRILGSK